MILIIVKSFERYHQDTNIKKKGFGVVTLMSECYLKESYLITL